MKYVLILLLIPQKKKKAVFNTLPCGTFGLNFIRKLSLNHSTVIVKKGAP